MGQSLALAVMQNLYGSMTMTVTTMVVLCGTCIGTLLPDIDEPKSTIGMRLPLVSLLVSLQIPHRTITHWLITRLALGVAIWISSVDHWSLISFFCYGLIFGMVIHDLGDLLTGGIKGYLWPILPVNRHIAITYVRVGSLQEELIVLPFAILLIYDVMRMLNLIQGLR